MKVSEIPLPFLQDWLGLPEDDDSLYQCLLAAISRASSYTGLTLAELDEHEDITMAVMGMVNDFYTNNRPDMAVMAINPMSKNILNMYSKNLL